MRFHLTICALAVLGLNACGDDSPPSMDAPEDDGGDTPYKPSQCPSDLPEMRIGMQATGVSQLIDGELTDAERIPIGWYHNDWSVRFAAPDGEPLESVTIDRAYTYMRDHNHEGGVDAIVEDLGDGEFSFEGLNVTMKGLWEFTFDVSAETADGEPVTDKVIFYVCNSQSKPTMP